MIKRFHTFYGMWKFITLFIWTCCWAITVEISHSFSLRPILNMQIGFFLSCFLTKIVYAFLLLLCMLHVLGHPSWFGHTINNTCCCIWLKSNKHPLACSVVSDLVHIKNNILLLHQHHSLSCKNTFLLSFPHPIFLP